MKFLNYEWNKTPPFTKGCWPPLVPPNDPRADGVSVKAMIFLIVIVGSPFYLALLIGSYLSAHLIVHPIFTWK